MRKRELERLLLEWQAALGLRDWDISLDLVHRPEMDDKDDDGDVDYVSNERDASIRIVRGMSDYEQEKTLVHELLHLWTGPMQEAGKDGSILEEQAINAISAALVNLKGQAHNSR